MDGIRQVTPTLWRGPRPLSQADVDSLVALGVRRVINLQSNMIDEALQVQQEQTWATALSFVHQPMSRLTPPDAERVAAVLRIIDDGTPTYLHCHDGVDRTGVCCAILRMNHGATFGTAIGEMIDDGFHLKPYELWLHEIQEWAK